MTTDNQFPHDAAAEVQAGAPATPAPARKRGKAPGRAKTKPEAAPPTPKPRKKREEPEAVRLARERFKADLLAFRTAGQAHIAATRADEDSAKRIAKLLARVAGWPKRDHERLSDELTKLVTPALPLPITP